MSKKKLQIKITEDVFDTSYIHDLRFTQDLLVSKLSHEPYQAIEYLAKLGMIKNQSHCSKCNVSMKLHKKQAIQDKYVWKCSRTRTHERSISAGSIFEGLKENTKTFMSFLRYWTLNTIQGTMAFELSLNKNTISYWSLRVREYVQDYLLSTQELLGGIDDTGTPKIVEIDESLFFRRKYNVGRYRDAQWVFGMIERGTSKSVLIPVPDRKAETLIPLIVEFVAPESIIISDCWASYRTISQHSSFIHYTVNHTYNFVNPEHAFAHTQTIENCWLHAKRILLNQHGTRPEFLNGYLYEFIFKKRFGKIGCFNKIIEIIRDQMNELNDS